MKKLQTQKNKQLYADLIDHPPVDEETDSGPLRSKNKKKKIYQLGPFWVEDIDINDVVE